MIEVLLVIAILLLLAGVAVVAFSDIFSQSQESVTRAKLNSIETALKHYHVALNQYPTTDQGLRALKKKPEGLSEKQQEKWFAVVESDKDWLDAWDREIKYERVSGDAQDEIGKPYKLWSVGPDGEDGTEDDIRAWDTGNGQDGDDPAE
jgi:general secretion pathway protein G